MYYSLTVRFANLDQLEFSPDHFVNNACVGLDDLDNLCRYVLFDVIWHRNSIVAKLVHSNSRVNRLQKSLFVDSGKDETRLIKCFGALG